MLYYNKTTKNVLRALNSDRNGLNNQSYQKAKLKHGENTLSLAGVPIWKKLIEPFLEPFTLILIFAIILSVIIHEYIDAVVIAFIIGINIWIDYAQKISTAKILRSLKEQATQEVTVKRNMEFIKVKENLLVPGDIVLLSEGSRVPADIRILEAAGLQVDEAVLTGESLPISKNADTLRGSRSLFEQTNMLFQGTAITAGTCEGVVTQTGNNTEFSKIAKLSASELTVNPLQKKVAKLVKQIILAVGLLSILIFTLLLIRGENPIEALRFILALAVSAIPEGLPITVTVILALGIKTMAKQKALVTNMRSLEVIGAVTAIATDKTGTLSKNKLSIQEYWQDPNNQTGFNIKMATGLSQLHSNGDTADPLDAVIAKECKTTIPKNFELIKSFPFVQQYRISGVVYKGADRQFTTFIKGSPEQLIEIANLTEAEREQAYVALNHFTDQGYRVIGVGAMKTKTAPNSLKIITRNPSISLIGFLAIADELRKESKPSVDLIRKAGISIHMITGDHANTALAIAKKLGIAKKPEEVIESSMLEKLTAGQSIKKYTVFSRIMPTDKYNLLTKLKEDNIVAMTGDGVNDAPALSTAHIGIAMGDGSQIAKDVSDIILLDNNFKTVAAAVKQGRIILDNIKRVLVYLLSTNAGEVITITVALLLGWPAPLLSIQILWVNIVTDTTMVVPLGIEPGDDYIMERPPAPFNAPLLSRRMVVKIIISAITIAATTLIIYSYYLHHGDLGYAQSAAFLALVVIQWANALTMRSHSRSIFSILKVKNNLFWFLLVISFIMQIIIMETPLASILHITPLKPVDYIIVFIISFLVPLTVSEAQKYIQKRHLIS